MFIYARSRLNPLLLIAVNILDAILSLIAPHHCLGCNKEGSICCQKCLGDLAQIRSDNVCYACAKKEQVLVGICRDCKRKQHLDGVFWFAGYEAEISKNLIESLKFNNNYQASQAIGSAISSLYGSKIKNHLSAGEYIVSHIPTANKRVRQRGWDQAELIAKSFVKNQKLAYKPLLLRVSSFDQIGASKKQRQEASVKFFKIRSIKSVKGKQIILIDDVLTTGSSFNAAAKILKQNGAKTVYAIAFARQGLKKLK
jgi:ComF family protein